MPYVDAFVLSVPKKNIQAYRRMSVKAGKVWREHGALAYVECVGDDLDMKIGVPFTRLPNIKKGETVMFSWIFYKSKADRNRINAKVMKDPRIVCDPDAKSMPFDIARMCFGGFKTLVNL